MYTLYTVILILFITSANAQQDAGVIWMGFEHEWSYNHRLNRLGDYISQPEFDGYDYPVKHVHTGATGLGWDEAYFTSYYTVLKTSDAGIQAGKTKFDLANKEGDRSSVRTTIELELEPTLIKKDRAVVLLNGFDLVAREGADKLKMLRIDISDPYYVRDGRSIRFEIEVGFIADCGSFECHRFRQQYNYDLEVHYLVLAGDHERFNTAEKSVIKSYEWDKHTVMDENMTNETVIGAADFPYAALGFKSLMINMDRDHWVVDWNTAIHPQYYDPQTGKNTFSVDMFLKQWKKRKESPFAIASRFSKRKDGWAYLGGTVVLLQFKEACLENKSHIGAVRWKGKNMEIDNSTMNVHRFRVQEGCPW